MAEAQVAVKKTPKPKLAGKELALARAVRRKKKAAGRKKRVTKLKTDKEFAKTYFEGRGKRANDKKAAFRKKKTRKK